MTEREGSGTAPILSHYHYHHHHIIIINIIITIVRITALSSSSAKARAVLRAISDVVLQQHSVARMKVRNAIQCTFIDELRGSVG